MIFQIFSQFKNLFALNFKRADLKSESEYGEYIFKKFVLQNPSKSAQSFSKTSAKSYQMLNLMIANALKCFSEENSI